MKQTDVVRDYEICQALARDHGFQISPSSGDEFYVSRIDDDAASKVHGSIEEVRAFLEGYDLCDGRREDEAEAKAAESDKEEAMTERKTQAAHSGTRPSDCSLPEWCERVTFRSAGKGEVILRVPGFDKFGEKMATNRVLSVPLAWRLLVELATALEQEANAPRSAARKRPLHRLVREQKERIMPIEMLSLYWEHEDDLPEMDGLEYDLLFEHSRVIDGVRMFPYTRYWDHEKQQEVKAYLTA